MSDYMYLLESHLSAQQNRLVAAIQAAAAAQSVNVYLAGGALRDMLGGYPIRDLDFTVEGPTAKLIKPVFHEMASGTVISEDPLRKTFELEFPGGMTASISMSRRERYSKPGGKPQVVPATILEDLQGRDFTVNAIALSLNPASRGLLRDPVNGQGDLVSREIRATGSRAFFDDPIRMLRMVRLKHRLGFTVSERTQLQFDNAVNEGWQTAIPQSLLLDQLKRIGDEVASAEILRELDAAGLLKLFSKSLTGAKINYHALGKLEKLRRSMPASAAGLASVGAAGWKSFLLALTEKLSAKDKAELFRMTGVKKKELESLKKLQTEAKRLETRLRSATVRKPSHIFAVLENATSDEMLWILYTTQKRPVQDRVHNFLEKYLPMALEVNDEEIAATGAKPGTPKFEKEKKRLIFTKLDARPKPVEEIVVPEPVPVMAARGRAAR